MSDTQSDIRTVLMLLEKGTYVKTSSVSEPFTYSEGLEITLSNEQHRMNEMRAQSLHRVISY